MPRLPPQLIGRACENRVTEYLTVLSSGNLVVTASEVDIEGTDKHVNRRYGWVILKLQVKGRAYHTALGYIELNIDKADIPPGDPKYVVVLEYFPATAELGRYVWVIHSDDVRTMARTSGEQWKALMSPKPTSKDKWVQFRYEVKELHKVVDALLARVERGQTMLRSAREVRAVFGKRRRSARRLRK